MRSAGQNLLKKPQPGRIATSPAPEMLFGREWRGDEPVPDVRAQELLRAYQEDALAEVESPDGLRTASSEAANWNWNSSSTTSDSRRCCASAFRTAGGSMS